MGLSEKACEMARIVKTKEPKVRSAAVIEMRSEMNTILNNNTKITE
jgi:hypothetical protein